MFDADSHFYEQPDAFTRFLPADYAERGLRTITDEHGESITLAGSVRVTTGDSPRPKNGLVPRPGSLKEFLRRLHQASDGDRDDVWVPMDPAFTHRDPRLELLDEHGVEGALVFGGTVVSSEAFFDDVDALYVQQHAYNRWLDEEWGFDRDGRLFPAAVLSLQDLDRTVAELDWLIAAGVRAVMLPLGPHQGRSPADTYFDPVWSRLHEAGVVVTYHTSEAIYAHRVNEMWGERVLPARWLQTAWQWMNTYGERPLTDTLSSLVFWNLFGRFPNLRVAAVEFGCEWLPHFLVKLDKSRGIGRNGPWPGGPLPERPSKVLARHVSVVPFPEDDVAAVVEQIGDAAFDILAMGTDFPHAEGVAHPRDLLDKVDGFDAETVDRLMSANMRELFPAR